MTNEPSAQISHSGDESEARFLELVKVAVIAQNKAAGDARVVVGEQAFHVEIKSCKSANGGTINQVRAIKYNTLIIHTPNQQLPWIVVPAHILVERAATRTRGQHTEIPFESCAFGIGNWAAPYRCDDDALEQAVINAILDSEKHSELRQIMKELLRDIQRVDLHIKLEIKSALNR